MLYYLLFLPAAQAIYFDWCDDNQDAKECCASEQTNCEDVYLCTCSGGLNTTYLIFIIAAALVLFCLCAFVFFSKLFRRPSKHADDTADTDDKTDDETDDKNEEKRRLLF